MAGPAAGLEALAREPVCSLPINHLRRVLLMSEPSRLVVEEDSVSASVLLRPKMSGSAG